MLILLGQRANRIEPCGTDPREGRSRCGCVRLDEVARHHARRVRELGLEPEIHSGSIACPQRFGSTLNLNPHVHLVAIDGVYARSEPAAPLVFHALPPPSLAEVEAVSLATCLRVVRLLERRGLTTDEGLLPRDEHALTEHERTAALAARQPSLFARVDGEGRVERVRPSRRPARAGEVRGFSVHAGVCARAGEVERRRRIVRYCLRPPFAAAPFRLTQDGRVAFQLRPPPLGRRDAR